MLDADNDEVPTIGKAGQLLKDFLKKYPNLYISKKIKKLFASRQDIDDIFITALNKNQLARAFVFGNDNERRLIERLTDYKCYPEISRYKESIGYNDFDEDEMDMMFDDINSVMCDKCR